jgi:hypothetical protein
MQNWVRLRPFFFFSLLQHDDDDYDSVWQMGACPLYSWFYMGTTYYLYLSCDGDVELVGVMNAGSRPGRLCLDFPYQSSMTDCFSPSLLLQIRKMKRLTDGRLLWGSGPALQSQTQMIRAHVSSSHLPWYAPPPLSLSSSSAVVKEKEVIVLIHARF